MDNINDRMNPEEPGRESEELFRHVLEEHLTDTVPETPQQTPAQPPEETPEENPAASPTETISANGAPAADRKKPSRLQNILKSKLLLGVIAVAVFAVIILTVILSRDPLSLVVKGAKNTYESLSKNPVVELLDGVYTGGSTELVMDLETLTQGMLGIGVDGSASLKLYTKLPTASAAVLNLTMDGETVLDASLIADQDELAVSSAVLLGGESYGINTKTAAENFDQSVFGYDGAYSLGIENIEDYFGNEEANKKMAEDAEKLASKMLEVVGKSLKEHAQIEKRSETVQLPSGDIEATAVEIKLEEDDLAAFIGDMVTWMQGDADLKNFLEENAQTLNTAANMYGYDYYEDDELVEEFYDTLEYLAEELDTLAENLEDCGLTMVNYVSKSGKYLVGVEFILEDMGEKVRLSVYAGPSLEDLQGVSFRIDDGYTKYKGTYTVEENTQKEFSAELKVREDNEVILSSQIHWDKKDGDLELEAEADGSVAGLEGSLTQSGKVTTLSVDEVYADGETLELGMDVILHTSDAVPDVPDYTDVLTLDEDQVEELIYDLYDTVQDLAYLMY